MRIINTKPSPILPIIVDFGWYFGTEREPPFRYISNGVMFPPGFTTLSSPFSLSESFPTTINVTSTASFDPHTADYLVINDGVDWALVSFTDLTSTSFLNCTLVDSNVDVHTWATNTDVWSQRFYVDSAPLQTEVTFDAIDSLNKGLNKTNPLGHQIIEYRWDFGNGTHGFGPVANTIYPYNQVAPSVNVALTVRDNLNRQYSCSHVLFLIAAGGFPSLGGSATREGG